MAVYYTENVWPSRWRPGKAALDMLPEAVRCEILCQLAELSREPAPSLTFWLGVENDDAAI